MLVQINISLKEGYKPVMADGTETEIEFYMEARTGKSTAKIFVSDGYCKFMARLLK